MPLYEYLCEDCEGIFETVKPMKEADEPAPCPVCDADGQRLMPTSFTAFIVRKGYPRRIPDKGTYWHLGQEVTYLPKQARPYEHPQIQKERRRDPLSQADIADLTERKIMERRGKREEARKKRALTKDAQSRRKKEKLPPRQPGKINL